MRQLNSGAMLGEVPRPIIFEPVRSDEPLLKTTSHFSAPFSSRSQEQSATIVSLQRRITESEAETSAAREQAATVTNQNEELKASARLGCASAWCNQCMLC